VIPARRLVLATLFLVCPSLRAELNIKALHANPPIGQYTASANAKTLVYIPRDAKPNGGPLYRFDLASGKSRRLTSGFAYIKGEVYADPELSPDGRSVVFAIHSSAKGDHVAAAGPFARMELDTGKITVLDITRMWGGVEPVFGTHPHWSPDGRRILYNVDGTFAIGDADGKTKRELGALTDSSPADERPTFALGWLGNECILFRYDSGTAPARDHPPVNVLSLRSKSVRAYTGANAAAPEDCR